MWEALPALVVQAGRQAECSMCTSMKGEFPSCKRGVCARAMCVWMVCSAWWRVILRCPLVLVVACGSHLNARVTRERAYCAVPGLSLVDVVTHVWTSVVSRRPIVIC